ncbi:MAG: hypothetical protein HRK26_05210 [Rickettsiaceae bacterium H1]|nr:hypothetical protein [Rickettsiaceae bacterium H1]
MIKKVINVLILILLITSCGVGENKLENIPEILIPKDWGKKLEKDKG